MSKFLYSIIAFFCLVGGAAAQIPALKDGELIVVDSILTPSATLEAAEMEPLMLNIVKINMDEGATQPQSIDYQWAVSADGASIPFLVGLGGNYIGFTFRSADTITINVIVKAVYEVKDVRYEEVEEAARKFLGEVDAMFDHLTKGE